MARSRSLWTEWQRELTRRQRLQQQASRAADKAAARGTREEQQARRAAARQAASDETERKRLYVEDRRAEAATMTSELKARGTGIEFVLGGGARALTRG